MLINTVAKFARKAEEASVHAVGGLCLMASPSCCEIQTSLISSHVLCGHNGYKGPIDVRYTVENDE